MNSNDFFKVNSCLSLVTRPQKLSWSNMDPDIIFVSLKRHSMDFFDKVKKISLISVYFYTQSAQ